MKKLLLASAVAALSVSAANAAPTVYGKIFMTADYVDEEHKGINHDENGVEINSQSSRLGLKGSEPLSANTDIIYQLEYKIDVDNDNDDQTFKSRDTFLGVKNNTFGEFRVGHNQSTTDYINNVVVNEGYWDNLGDTDLGDNKIRPVNMADSGRIKNSVVWKAPKFDGIPLEFAAMYANDDNYAGEKNSGWGASLMFDQGAGYTLGVAYDDDVNLKEGSLIRGTATLDLATFNSGFPVTLGALYQEADYDDGKKKEKGYIISAEMGLTNFAKPAAIYTQYNNTSNLGGVKDFDSDQIVVGGKYYYQKNMIAHAYIGQNDADNVPGVIRDTAGNLTSVKGDGKVFAVGAGLEYKF
ncbi:porin [Psychrobacter phenylpyruvicus]|uniref:Porin n=1 Tax=Psychrobacter phenylpyruvicus TaxID=29432 RepID=A0A379LIB8_9GAMM|nr:porin [Psychrobacter phenylpyruvicus]SUD90340.1 Porin [Psychrobacter phenylpyruvicus]